MSVLGLRRASGRALVTLDDRCREPALDDGQERPIRNAPAHAAHQGAVRYRREVVAEVSIHHLRVPAVPDMPEGLANCHFGVHLRAEAILVAQQVRFENRAQHQERRHLDHAVADARDPERALAAVALWNPDAQQGLWPVFTGAQLLPQLFQPSLSPIGSDLIERHPVDARGATIAVACPVGFFEDVSPADFVPWGVEAESWFSLSFRMQRDL